MVFSKALNRSFVLGILGSLSVSLSFACDPAMVVCPSIFMVTCPMAHPNQSRICPKSLTHNSAITSAVLLLDASSLQSPKHLNSLHNLLPCFESAQGFVTSTAIKNCPSPTSRCHRNCRQLCSLDRLQEQVHSLNCLHKLLFKSCGHFQTCSDTNYHVPKESHVKRQVSHSVVRPNREYFVRTMPLHLELTIPCSKLWASHTLNLMRFTCILKQ